MKNLITELCSLYLLPVYANKIFMNKKYELFAERNEGLKQWQSAVQRLLSFAQAKISTPTGFESDMFSGWMKIEELNDESLTINIKSSAQKICLSHNDFLCKKKGHFFIINSCNNLLVKSKDKRIIVPPGDSIFIPGWNEYTEESFSNRTSVSIIMEVQSVFDEINLFESLAWKKVSSLTYGMEINKILTNFYLGGTEKFLNKNLSVLKGLLALEAESLFCLKEQKKDLLGAGKLAVIIDFIKKHIRESDLRLSSVANLLGVTERMVQYILSEHGLKFHELLMQERCCLLAHKLKENKFTDVNVLMLESGFDNIATACRAFKKRYNSTPRQFQKKFMSS